MKKPLIAIAGNILFMEGGDMPGLPRDYVNRDYSVSVKNGGGIPMIIPPQSGLEDIERCIAVSDGLILSGGYDISPDLYGEIPDEKLGFTLREVDLFYKDAIEVAIKMHKPILGICLGHQMISLALGAKTFKMKFGHRGGNHPVMNLETGKIEITSQNHSYAVDVDSLKDTELELTHKNLLDNTAEGVASPKNKLFSVQYHPESAPGPQDSAYLFDKFIALMEQEDKNNA